MVHAEAQRHALVLRGAFVPEDADGVPPLAPGVPARALVLLGNAGSSLWPAFAASVEYRDGRPDPLDRWSSRVGGEMARRLGARALFPFGGPPHRPFLRWARRADAVFASPVGMLIHPEYGLWHAYRFALAFAQPLDDMPQATEAASPCGRCSARPCLTGCPAQAFVAGEYRLERCLGHLRANPDASCWTRGCEVRRRCPVGSDHRYTAAQAQFHVRAFVANFSA